MSLNQIVSLPTPSSGLGPATDVSTLTDDKSFEISGNYAGRIVIFGSHDGSTYVPLLIFDSGAGAQAYKQSLSVVTRFLKVFRNTSSGGEVGVFVASGTSTLNNFIALGTLGVGAKGPQTSVDLWTLVPATGLNANFSIFGRGAIAGVVAIEGSQDNIAWNPLGSFVAGAQSTGVLNFSPLVVPSVVRFVRPNVLGQILQPMVLTIGGAQNVAATAGSSKGLLRFSGVVDQDGSFSFLADRGNDGTIIFNDTEPQNYPMPACTVTQLVAKATVNGTVANTLVTLMKNNVMTALTVTIPAGSTVAVSDLVHSVSFANGDLMDMTVFITAGAEEEIQLAVTITVQLL